MADDDKAAPAEEKKSGGSMGPLILGVLNLLVTAGLGAAIFMMIPQGEARGNETTADGGPASVEAAPPSDDGPGPVVELDDFVVQLRNPEFDRYLRVRFHVEVESEVHIVEIEKLLPKIRDDFISYMSDRTYEELRGSRGLKRVKRDLFARLLTMVPPESIRALLVTKFVVQ